MGAVLAEEADLGGQIAGWSVLSVLLVIGLAALIIYIAALVGIVRSENYAPGGKAIWALAVFAFPFLGPLFWFLWGRSSRFTT
ncbi:hypothetical protein GCM10022247_53390 [Allokutzneria multivorans]|uniref:Cardiolipin synthase N-terminal domain-containing protein n=1 Tax=Allokutzneria multivorans TaxID=1142134 RepID=A0ABP7T8J4_9PSEU